MGGTRVRRPIRGALGAALLACALAPAARAAEELDLDLASKILLKVLLLDQDLTARSGGKVVIGVIGSPPAVDVFAALEGTAIDASRTIEVSDVVAVKSLPPEKRLTVLFVGPDADVDQVVRYTRSHGVLSATNLPQLVERGVTLGVGLENRRPKVLLNLTGSDGEKLRWDTKILKISRVYR
jgi:hypothetical protein